MDPINTNALRQALIAQAMARQNPIAYPAQGGQPRVLPNGALPNGAPNTPGVPVPPTAQPPTPTPVNVAQRTAPANPAQNLAAVGQGAQSPMFDPGTRDIAKMLVAKLLKHI